MKLKNKITAIALCSTFAVTGLTGCTVFSGNDASKEETTTTTVATETVATETTDESSTTKTKTVDVNLEAGETLDASSMGVASTAAEELNSGNAAYLSGQADMNVSSKLREELTNGQKPHTVVITCSDSRVPPELIFNADLGELFTIRTAGNVVGDFEVGSVEYAVDHLGSQLVLVMGHSSCGAVGAAVEGHASGNVESIIHEITPSVEEASKTEKDEKAIADKAEDLNVENTLAKLRESSVIKELEESGKIKLMGAKYDIETGKVHYFSE